MLHYYLVEQSFKQSLTDTCVYTKHVDQSMCVVLVWVDDILVAANTDLMLNNVKDAFKVRFQMKHLGEISHFLGIDFTHEDNTITMSQSDYLTRLLGKHGMGNCKPKLSPYNLNMNKSCGDPAEPADARL